MKTRGKKYKEKAKLIEKGKAYAPSEAVKLLKEVKFAKFDETIDLAVVLGVDTIMAVAFFLH